MVALLAPAILSAALTGALAATVREVTTFPAGVWLENLAVRSNGDLLATRLDAAGEVISINPRTGAQRVLVSFPGAYSDTDKGILLDVSSLTLTRPLHLNSCWYSHYT